MSSVEFEKNLRKYYGVLTLLCVLLGFLSIYLLFSSPKNDISVTGLLIIIITIFPTVSKFFSNEITIIILLCVFVVVLLLAGLFYGYLLSRLLKVKKQNRKSFLYKSSMRDCIIPLKCGGHNLFFLLIYHSINCTFNCHALYHCHCLLNCNNWSND